MARERRAFIDAVGAVAGHPRTMKGYAFRWDRASLRRWLFGDKTVTEFWLYRETVDDAYLAHVQALFPEAKIQLQSDEEEG